MLPPLNKYDIAEGTATAVESHAESLALSVRIN